jgi:subtilisin family serine protease
MPKQSLLTLLSASVLTVAASLAVPSAVTHAAAPMGKSAEAAKLKDQVRGQRRSTGNAVYIVRMSEEPAASYKGRVRGYAATRPAEGEKLDASRPEVQSYRRYLETRHDAALSRVGGRKVYSYGMAFNGFAARLSEAQAEKLATVPGVLAVMKDEVRHIDTSSTPTFLGLDAHFGVWNQLGGARNAGSGIVVGIVDSGIWPENDSFDDKDRRHGWGGRWGGDKPIRGWLGECVDGEQFVGSRVCNGKIIGARYFNEGWGGDAGIEAQRPWEFNSPRDYNGHGSHTASTAAGNYRTKVTGAAAVFGHVSGIAPDAKIAVYKALWATQDNSTASGTTADLVAAIDQAVADGVDVINYSVSGTTTNFRDPVEIAFLYAADAGVFVAASAGNNGPTTGTVAHPSPWVTTVAAGTHNRTAIGTAKLGDGTALTGAGLAATAVTAPLINSTDAGLPGATATAVSLCYSTTQNGGAPALDPAKVAGKIVVCDRGVSARVDKSLAVQEAGGVGMILLNPTENSLNGDLHSVPSVHLQNTSYAAVHAYAALPGATATIDVATIDYSTTAPLTASFSSRGPLTAGGGDLLKPDLIAPGQDILAAYSPALGGHDFNLLSGTSMSSPHVAGLAALFKQKYPWWSPMRIKSALMTTGTDVLDGGTPAPNTNPVLIFRQGAGHVAPNKAVDPGLVFDSGWKDWLGFLCGTQLPTVNCTSEGIPVLDPSDFNSPSIAIGDLPGVQTVTRTVTNVSWLPSTYNVSVSGPAGMTVTVTPSKFTIWPGAKQKLTVKFQRTTAALNAFAGGQITWSDGWHKVRVPVVVRPVALGAPAEVGGSYSVKFGYDGPFTTSARGLVPATTAPGTVAIGDYNIHVVNVPAGSTHARFSLFDANASAGSDLDLEVYNAAFTLVGSSGSATSTEEVNLRDPAPGTYYVLVVGYAAPAATADYTLFNWVLGTANAGNFTATAPATATTGGSGAITLGFSGLVPGTKYLGSVAYGGTTGMPNPTIVRVDP